MTEDIEGNFDGDRLLLVNSEEVYVEALVGYRMELKLVEDGHIGLSTEIEVDDVGCGSVGNHLEVLGFYCEEDVVHAEAIKVAGNETLFAEGLDDGLVTLLTDLSVELEMFHCS
jgi:hypothetical protein